MNQQTLQQKKSQVEEIVKNINESASVTVVAYHGLTVAEIQELRRNLAKEGATMTVYKNTMVRRALEEGKFPSLGDLLNGPNGFVFSQDLSKGPKVLMKFARHHDSLVLKGGLAEGRVLDEKGIKEVAKLPDKNGLIAMFLSCLNAPLTKFAATVQAIADKAAPAAN